MSSLAPAPLQTSSWLTAWRFDAVGVILALALLVPYVVLLARARSRGIHWPWWRAASYIVLGVGSLVYVTCGPVGVYRSTLMWMFAAQVAVVGTVTPVGLAIGDPLRLIEAAAGSRGSLVHRITHSRAARVLTFPAVSCLLDIGGILAVFLTPYGEKAARSTLVGTLLLVQLLVVGLLFVLPTLADDLLPDWATPAVRTFLAFFDGLADAVPGILVMTAHSLLLPGFPGFAASADVVRGGLSHGLDQQYAGGALLVVAETIGIPMLAAVFVEWLRSDRAEAAVTDARLDDLEARRRAQAPDAVGTGPDQPWWLTDPRLADRFGRHDDS
ncbi:cytochrome c oxidase assembly protein [Flexivirga sp. ID2601S]|uniref:Cytochrome c oxidase assembly protein n=1 Tax=Flexivirga aerilata TaxID=1656889 RepID=A0A849AMA5_9MICO|nr:cytochrome c oxidase assembly protein [Flexivirga aerilata]